MNKFKMYAIITQNNKLAQCMISEKPLIANDKSDLEKLLSIMQSKTSEYDGCKIVCLKQTWW